MQRNLHRRVETCFPILDPVLKARVIEECLDIPLAANSQAWELQPDATWRRRTPEDKAKCASQEILIARYGTTGSST
jgi:polyphosphate kinase